MLIRFDTLQPWSGSERLPDENGVLYPSNIEELWSAADLAAIGLAIPLPFTAPDGFHAIGAPRYELDGSTIKTVYDTEADIPVVPEVLTRWQFFAVAALNGIITQQAAQAALAGTMPQPFVDFITTLPADQQFPATMLLGGTQEFHRHHPFVQAFLTAKGMTDAQADAIWIQGAALTLS